jgi:superfamily II DNA or RNA helicase
VQKIIAHVQNSDQNGYIWHTTGSGKTLTSFKASQLIMKMPDVEKVCLWWIVMTLIHKLHESLMLLKPRVWIAQTARILW